MSSEFFTSRSFTATCLASVSLCVFACAAGDTDDNGFEGFGGQVADDDGNDDDGNDDDGNDDDGSDDDGSDDDGNDDDGSDDDGNSAAGTASENSGGAGGTPDTSSNGGTSDASSGGAPTCTDVRPTGTDWDEATCAQWARDTSECNNAWMINGNYCNESCGRCEPGNGDSSDGGGSSSSGTGSGGSAVDIVSSCTESDLNVCDNRTGSHCGYTYEYWKDQGTGCMTNTQDGFSVEWSNINNLLGRKGVRPGSQDQVVTFDADYRPDGNSYLCVYGWLRNPLVEYYIVESWGNWRPPGDYPVVGTLESDDGTYELYQNERTGPSIDGNTTFMQYWSVRTAKRTSGTVTVGNHFAAWQDAGMGIGSLYEVSMCVEGYQSSGSADVRMMIE